MDNFEKMLHEMFEDIRNCYGKECDKCEYSVSHDAFITFSAEYPHF